MALSPSAGCLLVASRRLLDPNFRRSVVLLARYEPDDGAIGLILNRRTDVAIGTALGHVEVARKRREFLWVGGPVEGRSLWTLHQRRDVGLEGFEVQPGVRATNEAAVVHRLLAAPEEDVFGLTFRFFVGYAGWSAGQLEEELADGAWTVVPAGPAVLFSPEPGTLWTEMERRADLGLSDPLAIVRSWLN